MAAGEASEKATTAETAPAAGIVIAISSGESGSSVNRNGDPRTTLGIGNVDVTPAVRAEERRKGKEKGAAIDLEKGMGVRETEGEKLCRICHLGSEMVGPMEEGWELIVIGCRCKGDLGIAHRRCAEAWFRVKGNRLCEICRFILVKLVELIEEIKIMLLDSVIHLFARIKDRLLDRNHEKCFAKFAGRLREAWSARNIADPWKFVEKVEVCLSPSTSPCVTKAPAGLAKGSAV